MKNFPGFQIGHQFPTLLMLIVSSMFLCMSCARKISFATSTVVPAAEGTVKVKKDNNDNYAIKVEVKNLAEPHRLPQPRKVYVVWMQTANNGIQNLGQLSTSSGLFSSTLKASIEAVTAYKPTRLFITGEDAANVAYPGNYVVLNTSSF
jgi:hypothetical protein